MLLRLTDDERDLIATALSLWRNHIETGNIVLSAADAAERGLLVRPLGADQLERCVALIRLREKVLTWQR